MSFRRLAHLIAERIEDAKIINAMIQTDRKVVSARLVLEIGDYATNLELKEFLDTCTPGQYRQRVFGTLDVPMVVHHILRPTVAEVRCEVEMLNDLQKPTDEVVLKWLVRRLNDAERLHDLIHA